MLQIHQNPQGGCPAGMTMGGIYSQEFACPNHPTRPQSDDAAAAKIVMRAVEAAMSLTDDAVPYTGGDKLIDQQAKLVADVAARYARALAAAKKQLAREVWQREATDSPEAGRIPCRAVRVEHLATEPASDR